jgi:hypothetical protein
MQTTPRTHHNGTELRAKGLTPLSARPGPPESGGAHRTGDLIHRRRDAQGNRLPWFYAHRIATVDDTPLRETALTGAIDAIRAHSPIDAFELEHCYEQKLRPALRHLIAVRTEEEARLKSYNQKVSDHGEALDREIERVSQDDRNTLAEAERSLNAAHLEAARKVAETGGAYDPEDPTPECALRIPLDTEAVLAAGLGLPWTPADKKVTLPPFFSALLTLIVGGMVGLSLGILSGYVPAGNWLSKPVALTFFGIVGIAAAIFGKWGIRLSAREPSQRYWLGKPWTNWLLFVVISVMVAGTLVTIDSFVEREGLMANFRMQALANALAGQARPEEMGAREWLYFLMAIILTFGYAVNGYWEGYLSGRYDACLNRIQREQVRLYREADTLWRAKPGVQAALEAIARVQKLLQEKRLLEMRVAERTAQLETRRHDTQEEFSEEARRRIQDALDQFNGVQATFDTLFADVKVRCLEGQTLGQRVVRAIWGGPKIRQRQADQKRRIR